MKIYQTKNVFLKLTDGPYWLVGGGGSSSSSNSTKE